MLNDLKAAISRSGPTLIQDVTGAAALVVMLVVGLFLPAML